MLRFIIFLSIVSSLSENNSGFQTSFGFRRSVTHHCRTAGTGNGSYAFVSVVKAEKILMKMKEMVGEVTQEALSCVCAQDWKALLRIEKGLNG